MVIDSQVDKTILWTLKNFSLSGVCTWHPFPSALKENLKYYNHDVSKEDLGPQNSAAVCSVP